MVRTKLWPRAAYTHEVRKIQWRQPDSATARSPASFVRPYADSGAGSSSST
jgi:hypothetical protein